MPRHHYDWLIIGAGFTGAVLAERIASQLNQTVLLVDRRDHIGGNAFDYMDEAGILVPKYGPHIFHTNSKKVWDYLSEFTEWWPYYHHVLGVVEGRKVPIPFNMNSLYQLFPPRLAGRLEDALLAEYRFGSRVPILTLMKNKNPDLQLLAEYIYENVFYNYTVKQWGLTPKELAPSVTTRVPVRVSRDDRYFQDRYQAMPAAGYTAMFDRMLSHPNIHLLLNTGHTEVLGEVRYGRAVYCGAVDELLGYRFGPLPYRSLRFEFQTLGQEWFQEVGTVNYPNEADFTRITEQKHLTGQKAPRTTVIYEYPQVYEPGRNEPYYPIPRDENQHLHARYLDTLSEEHPGMICAGRLGDYCYYNMDQAVARALSIFEKQIAPGRAGEILTEVLA